MNQFNPNDPQNQQDFSHLQEELLNRLQTFAIARVRNEAAGDRLYLNRVELFAEIVSMNLQRNPADAATDLALLMEMITRPKDGFEELVGGLNFKEN